jgi:hypothetical protein
MTLATFLLAMLALSGVLAAIYESATRWIGGLIMSIRSFQAIVTRYHGPGNVRGSRVKATAQAGSITLDWDDALGSDENHMAAAKALADKFKWRGWWHTGGLPDGSQVHVCHDIGDEPAFVTKGENWPMTDTQVYRLFTACFATAFVATLFALAVVTLCPVILWTETPKRKLEGLVMAGEIIILLLLGALLSLFTIWPELDDRWNRPTKTSTKR